MIKLALSFVALALVACASSPSKPDAVPASTSATPATTSTTSTASAPAESSGGAAKKSLFDRLGGKGAIEAVVDDFLGNVAGDVRIQHRFALSDLKDLRNKLVDQICAATGGPCQYKGGDMKSVHHGMRIKGAEFDALVEDLVKSLDKLKVPTPEKNELLGALAPMKADIVEEP
jgi:hemoglobin